MSGRDNYVINKPTPVQYSISKNQIKAIIDEIKPLDEYENAIKFFDDILGL